MSLESNQSPLSSLLCSVSYTTLFVICFQHSKLKAVGFLSRRRRLLIFFKIVLTNAFQKKVSEKKKDREAFLLNKKVFQGCGFFFFQSKTEICRWVKIWFLTKISFTIPASAWQSILAINDWYFLLLPEPRTSFHVRLIDGTARIFSAY